ncbi:MAG: CinA family protein [Acidiferrobacterales bacterium]
MELDTIARKIGSELKAQKLTLVSAESCTGGWVGQVITSVSGSSRWYDRGFITYSNQAKREQLGVSTDVLARFGAVSEQAARAMAEGALANSHAQISLAITGIAGPDGGSENKPVGTVWFAWSGKSRETQTELHQFDGDRTSVRQQAVEVALLGIIEFISD